MKTSLFVLGALWGLGTAAFGQAPPAADPVVLTIGAEKITRSQFDQILATLPDQQRAMGQTPAGRRQVAEQLADLKILAQEARTRKLDQSAEMRAKLAIQADQVLASAAYQELSAAKPEEAAARAFYAEHKQDYEELKARHILIRMKGSSVPLKENQKDLTDEEALAKTNDLRAKIVAGAKFADVAKAESDDTGSGENGGDLGPFTHGSMVPQFEEAAFALAPGKISDPVKTQFGYHLILVGEHGSKPFDDVRAEIEQKMRPEMAQTGLANLKKKATVLYDEEFFGK